MVLAAVKSTWALTHVDLDVFRLRYFQNCMGCTFCFDQCCSWGCDVDLQERTRLRAVGSELAAWTVGSPEEWFAKEERADPDFESGASVRTNTMNGRCAFSNVHGRGCGIHAFAMASQRDYHQLKPRVCWLFPLTWDRGILMPSSELREDLICGRQGVLVYDAAREELRAAFGSALVNELDALRAQVQA